MDTAGHALRKPDMEQERKIVLVTGSNGHIGSAVMQRLAGRFSDVVGFDRQAPSPPPPGCTGIPVDIASDQSVQEGLRILREHHGTRFAAVVHLAAYYDFLGEPSPKYEEITVQGTRRLLHGLREGFEVEQFIFSSTMLVHRPGDPGEFLTEDWPIGPTWAYPESKVRTEALIRAERGDIPAVILRFAGVYDDLCHSPPLAHQIQRIYERQLAGHLYSGETSHGQSFVHLDDAVDAIEHAVERRAQMPAEIAILIGEPQTLSYDELQHTFARLLHGDSWETHDVPGPIAKVGAWVQGMVPGQDPFIKPWMIDRANDHYALDITRARTVLEWAPAHSFAAPDPAKNGRGIEGRPARLVPRAWPGAPLVDDEDSRGICARGASAVRTCRSIRGQSAPGSSSIGPRTRARTHARTRARTHAWRGCSSCRRSGRTPSRAGLFDACLPDASGGLPVLAGQLSTLRHGPGTLRSGDDGRVYLPHAPGGGDTRTG